MTTDDTVIFSGDEFMVDDIENIFLGEDNSTNPAELVIYVLLKGGQFKQFPTTEENINNYHRWFSVKARQRLNNLVKAKGIDVAQTFKL